MESFAFKFQTKKTCKSKAHLLCTELNISLFWSLLNFKVSKSSTAIHFLFITMKYVAKNSHWKYSRKHPVARVNWQVLCFVTPKERKCLDFTGKCLGSTEKWWGCIWNIDIVVDFRICVQFCSEYSKHLLIRIFRQVAIETKSFVAKSEWLINLGYRITRFEFHGLQMLFLGTILPFKHPWTLLGNPGYMGITFHCSVTSQILKR